MSQHKDHAHKKLRSCLQQSNSNLTVRIAVRLTLYTQYSKEQKQYSVDIQTLAQSDLPIADVQKGLRGLVHDGMLVWHDGEIVIHLSETQMKRLTRFYREE
jgi:hypothetical protein